MAEEKPETEEDEILKRLNEQLEQDERETKINEEVEKRLEEHKKREPRDAVFKTRDGQKKRVTKEKKYECPRCGSEESKPLGNEETIYKHGGHLLSAARYCEDCGYKWGVVKE